jgi:hypothetical protein
MLSLGNGVGVAVGVGVLVGVSVGVLVEVDVNVGEGDWVSVCVGDENALSDKSFEVFKIEVKIEGAFV